MIRLETESVPLLYKINVSNFSERNKNQTE